MTVGKDVSALFTDVTMCMQTDNLELKKLVYLYLINYAKTQPDLAILAVNTFVKVWYSSRNGATGYVNLWRIICVGGRAGGYVLCNYFQNPPTDFKIYKKIYKFSIPT